MLILDFDKSPEAFAYKHTLLENAEYLDMSDIPGTDMYCDDLAIDEIGKRIEKYGPFGTHFFGSGNYHYMSLLFARWISEDFELLLVDNHTDMQEPAFGGILSCGSWALELLKQNENLRRIYLLGPSDERIESLGELSSDLRSRVVPIRREQWQQSCGSFGIDSDLPVYVSIDKDALNEESYVTNWDQGVMSIEQLTAVYRGFTQKRRVLGVDICGGLAASETDCRRLNRAQRLNPKCDAKILDMILQ